MCLFCESLLSHTLRIYTLLCMYAVLRLRRLLKRMKAISSFGHNEVIGSRFILCLNHHLNKIHETTILRHWITGNSGQWSLRKGNKWDEPYKCPSSLSGESFQATAQRERELLEIYQGVSLNFCLGTNQYICVQKQLTLGKKHCRRGGDGTVSRTYAKLGRVGVHNGWSRKTSQHTGYRLLRRKLLQ